MLDLTEVTAFQGFLLIFVPVTAGVLLIAWIQGQREQRQIQEREQQQRDREREAKCLGLLNTLKFLFQNRQKSIYWNEFRALIREGTEPHDLEQLILDQIEGTSGPLLGDEEFTSPVTGSVWSLAVRWKEVLHDLHLYIVGKSGYGKTNLLCQLALQIIDGGHGLVLLATELELILQDLLPRIKRNDVVYVNPMDYERPISLNPLHARKGERLDWIVSSLMTIFENLFPDIRTGVRMRNILRQAIKTLVLIPDTTLFDVEKLLDRADPTYRKWVLTQIKDKRLIHFWKNVYEAYPPTAHHSVLNRLNEILDSPVISNVLCAPGPCFDFKSAMDNQKVILVNLSDGVLGSVEARLLGQFIVSKIQIATLARASMHKTERRRNYLVIDEFQRFVSSSPKSYEIMLERGRKYNVPIILAQQQTKQLPKGLLAEVLGCTSTLVVFRTSADDAVRLSKELLVTDPTAVPDQMRKIPVNPALLQQQEIGSAYVRLDDYVVPNMKTHLLTEKGDDILRDSAIYLSREKYGISRDSHLQDRSSALKNLNAKKVF